jgi:hypothetical protein
MINHVIVALGLNQFSDGDMMIIISAVVAMCGITGIISDFLMKPYGFGVIGNALILLLAFTLAMVLFQNMHLHRPDPLLRLVFGMSISFGMLFGFSLLKKAAVRTN